MFSLFPRSNALRNWPLSLGLLFVAAPLISPSAKAQTASLNANTPTTPDTPQLSDGSRPGSAIAGSQRASLKKSRWREQRSLLMSVPNTNPAPTVVPVSTPVVVAPAASPLVSASSSATKTAAPNAPVPATTVSSAPTPAAKPTIQKIVVPAPPAVAPPVVVPPVITPKVITPGAVVAKPERLAAVAVVNPIPDATTPTSREKAARLPARGGPILNPTTIQVRPEAAAVAPPPAVSETDRLMLAKLDADLAKAQRRLNRAETRLSEGQRQLGQFTGVLQSAMLEAGDDARGLHPFVRVAQRYLGTPYVWGGESARGFDCSGFIMRVMRDLGYRALPHSAAEQFRYGMPISKGLLKPGDVVFFANTYKPGISHVGIYLGRGRFIHAANSHVGTIVSSLNEPKWVEKYAGARRLLPVSA